jgi:6-pyruvoyl-tetrahydropterin synthase
MKYFKIFLLVLLFPIITASSEHKFYVSITKIEYVKEKNSLQIITKIFIDDIEDALQQRYDTSISLDTKKETKAADEDVKNYLFQKIKIKVNGKPLTLDYIGKEYETDMLVAYLEIKNIKELKTIQIENKLLMEIFPEQQNIIHLKTSKSRKSLILDSDEPSGKLEFN